MKPRTLGAGIVVQIDPNMGGLFPGCFAVVTESRSWGVLADVHLPGVRSLGDDGTLERTIQIAPVRLAWEHIELIGAAKWMVNPPTAEVPT